MAVAKPEVNRSQVIRDFVSKNPTMPNSEVVTKLGEEGVKVSKNLVYIVKMKMKAKKLKEKKAKAAAKESQAAATASSNGSKKAPSKSSAVRAVLKGNRKMQAKDVVSALAEKGISVTEGLVYFVKGQMKGKRGQKKKAQKAAAQVVAAAATTTVAPVSSNGDAVKTIMMVKGWAAQVGGMKTLAALVQALSD
jgi:arginine repressor